MVYVDPESIRFSEEEIAFMEKKCPDSFTASDKEGIPITVTRHILCTVLRVGEKGGSKDRTEDMARKLNVSRKTFKELIEKVWGAKSMPSLPVVKNIQDGSAGFGDETLNGFGWADAKTRGVGLLAFFCTLSQKQRKVLEDENKKGRWTLNPKTGETELVSVNLALMRQHVDYEDPLTGATETVTRGTANARQRVDWENPLTGATETVTRSTANGRQLVDWENPLTGATETVPRSTANGRQLVDWEDPVTGATEEVPRSTANGRQLVDWEDPVTGATETVTRSTANGRQLVDWEDPVTGATETVTRSTANGRQLVPFQDQYIRRSAKQSIINREKEGKRCPCGDKCPSCDIQTSRFWITLRKAKDYFVQTGDDCGYELADEDVVDYWCKIAPKLSKEMFRANGANERVVCKYCFRFAIRRFAEELGATTIFIPR